MAVEPAAGLVELKIPAHAEFIPVAKWVASTRGSQLGFTLEGLEDLKIAVAQACDSAIEQAQALWGSGSLHLTFSSTPRGLAVEVEALAPTSTPLGRRPARVPARDADRELQRLAHEVIRCFVDDFRASVEPRRVRLQMVKYLIG